LFGWGLNKNGQLGFPYSDFETVAEPRLIAATDLGCIINENIKKAFCGYEHTCVITESGKIYLIGNRNEQPLLVDGFIGDEFTQVSFGPHHMLLLV
jgi:alpha-tubulin suppressor-like RCC1 family protein